MALKDKFRIDELVKKGSTAVRRDTKGQILVNKIDGKEVRPESNKKEDSFGTKPIKKSKPISPKLKEELNEQEIPIKLEQESYGGETAADLVKPKYNEDELKKAIDVKVDELIKKRKLDKKDYILKSRYDSLQKKYEEAQDEIRQLNLDISTLESEIESLKSQLDLALEELDSAKLQQSAAENEAAQTNERYSDLLGDFSTAIIKGTKEGIERVSLAAQVRGLQAQKYTLKELLEAQKGIVESLQAAEAAEEAQQEETAILRSLSGPPNSYKQEGDYAWKLPENNIKQQGELDAGQIFYFRSNRKSCGWHNGNDLELYNFNEEKEVSYSFNIKTKSGGHGSAWIGFSKMTGTIPARSGSTPGKVNLTAVKVRKVSSPKGRRKVFDDTITLTIDGTTFTMVGRFYRKLRSGGKGN